MAFYLNGWAVEGPANTTGYMIGGYVVFALAMIIYLTSLFGRARRLKRELALLQALEESQR